MRYLGATIANWYESGGLVGADCAIAISVPILTLIVCNLIVRNLSCRALGKRRAKFAVQSPCQN